jgi:L-amino acid N-acyltransferase
MPAPSLCTGIYCDASLMAPPGATSHVTAELERGRGPWSALAAAGSFDRLVAGEPRQPPPGTPLRIRPAGPGDAEAIAAIYNEAVRSTTGTFDTEPRSTEDQISRLRHHDARHPVLVAENGGEVTGWASLSPWSERRAYEGTAEISVYVAERWRNRGVGRTLVAEIIAIGRAVGLHTILAGIAEGNPASRRLHLSVGFETVGVTREVGFKFGRFLDVELLQLILSQAPTGA